ncbi:hypothetical protein ACI3E1_07250 [Ligilactobacillus sp. LYQ139]|uniref:hypothetical protein n=1 Tax=Ligilactobacillus sp. LYQ139 TaxID=3378800 RepID=UPI0038531706
MFENFNKYNGDWYSFLDADYCDRKTFKVVEQKYSLNLNLNIRDEDVLYFRLEEFKEFLSGSKTCGPKDCDLTILEGKDIYQIEIKDRSDCSKVVEGAKKQLESGDDLLRFILWFVDPEKMCGLKNIKSKHAILFVRQRDTLERGYNPKEENGCVKLYRTIDKQQKMGTFNLRKIMETIKGIQY